MRVLVVMVLCVASAVGPICAAALDPSSAGNLDQLLDEVRKVNESESAENRQRLADFQRQRDQQERLLAEAKAALVAEEKVSAELKAAYDANEKLIPELTEKLKNREGTLGEVFGVVRQVAGDTRGEFQNSLISAQFPGRDDFLNEVTESRANPKMDHLEKLWFMLQQQTTEQGKVVRFPAKVVSVEGGEEEKVVTRVGPFNAVAGGQYLQFIPETGKLGVLARQPESRHLETAATLEDSTGVTVFAVDPALGSILNKLIEKPSFEERVDQGGPIGYVTIVLGVLGGLLGLYRLLYLSVIGRKIRAQVGRSKADSRNPLGRILSVYEDHRRDNTETLELKLNEAILREISPLERGESMIKVLSVVAPLLGLLGTVTGMIQTFQAITLFGTGDPKMMAGGISEALVTTVIGLIVAIPLTLLHAVVSSHSGSLVQILEEQSAGLIAEHAEESTPGPELRRVAVG